MHRQNGEGRAGFIITLAVFGLGIFLAVKIVPARIDGYQFREGLREEARYASVHRDDREIHQRVMELARELEIPLEPKNVKIRRTTREVAITARYDKPIDLKFTTYTYRFRTEQTAPVF